jgi:anti-sigma-K factor RskA
MNPSEPATHAAIVDNQEIDGALAALAAVQPREGLEQRVLARIASAPELPWHRGLWILPMGHYRWALAAASAVIVAGGVTMTTYRHRPTPAPMPLVVRAPRPAQQAAAAAASVGVSDHPLQTNKAKTRHRGVHRSYRAVHEHVPLPRGTAAPMRPQTIPAPQ